MAEEEVSECDSAALKPQLETLLGRYSGEELRGNSQTFCSDFCKLVEEFTSRWRVPLPQLRILETSLCYFARVSTSLPCNCDHVLHTLSCLALSVFELLLFFDQKDFDQEPLQCFSATFQECYSVLVRHQNVHLHQVERLVGGGGPWASSVLQTILSETSLPQNEVDEFIGSELPVFFELRVRYLLSCGRVGEAMALAKCCSQHPTAGQQLVFLQIYLTWLYKTSQHDHLHKEVEDVNGKDAVHIICSLESEEKDDLLLALSRAFLSQQLQRGDVCNLCDLVLMWCKLHSRLDTTKKALLEESRQLMLSATNVNSIFPFIKVIHQELGGDGVQFCVELCANALESCLPCDMVTKSLIYKTIAGLLPNDLEVCRLCALLVFFLERTVDAYKLVHLLYMHPDQEYHVEYSPIGNHVRFELLRILKKDLYFDPEFWNLIALRASCLELMSEKVVSAALEEIMEDKWISSYCTKESTVQSSRTLRRKGRTAQLEAAALTRQHEEDNGIVSKRLKVGPGRPRLNIDHTGKKKRVQESQSLEESSSKSLRRSLWRVDRLQDSVSVRYGEHRRTTRLSEKNRPKRRIKTPKWLLEDSGSVEQNITPRSIRKKWVKFQNHHRAAVLQRSQEVQEKNVVKQKPPTISFDKAKEDQHNLQSAISLDCLKSEPPPQVILELSLPDNELSGTFNEDSYVRQRGIPQILLYKPTVKSPTEMPPVKTAHRKEVILRARDTSMLVQQLHCYARRQKGKGNGSILHGSVSTITRSSVQLNPSKDGPKEKRKRSLRKGGASTRMIITRSVKAVSQRVFPARGLDEKFVVETEPAAEPPVLDAVLQLTAVSQTSAENEEAEAPVLEPEEPAVEMKVIIASQTSAVKMSQSAGLEKKHKAQSGEDLSVFQATAIGNNEKIGTDYSNTGPPGLEASQNVLEDGKQKLTSFTQITTDSPKVADSKEHASSENMVAHHKVSEAGSIYLPANQDSMNDLSSLTLVTEMVTELEPEILAQDLEKDRSPSQENCASKMLTVRSKPKMSSSSCSVPVVADVQSKKGEKETKDVEADMSDGSDDIETAPESEEAKLEFCCTFCNKDVKGSRVVAHAMFHYRRDECMFCGMMFKDDLLAMMHLSDHIEKLKRIKAQENCISEKKGTSLPKTFVKSNVSPGPSKRGRPRKSHMCPNPAELKDSTPSEFRKLRSNVKEAHVESLQEKKLKAFQRNSSTHPVHQVNGQLVKKAVHKLVSKQNEADIKKNKFKCKAPRTELTKERSKNSVHLANQSRKTDSAASSIQASKQIGYPTKKRSVETTTLQISEAAAKKKAPKVVKEKNLEHQQKVVCPMDGCAWFTDFAKNRVALLYHALEDHYGEVKPLKLAFRIGHSRCLICMRVLWSFEHLKHHVETHRIAPRYPCLHQGCTARFKTGMDMRRHTRRHNPLQAECCHPGCSKLFICLWALNLHEREHYTSKLQAKPDKTTSTQKGDEHSDAEEEKKQKDPEPKAPAPKTAMSKSLRLKVLRKLRSRIRRASLRIKAKALSSVGASEPIQEKTEKKETNDSNDKNLSSKGTMADPRLGPPLRKVANTTVAAPKTFKVISSSLLKHKTKLKYKLNNNQVTANAEIPKRRGRPPKLRKRGRPKKTSMVPKSETVTLMDQKRLAPPKSALLCKGRQVREAIKAAESKYKKPVLRQMRRRQKGVWLRNMSTAVASNGLNQPTRSDFSAKIKLNTDNEKKRHIIKTRPSPQESTSKIKKGSGSQENKRNKNSSSSQENANAASEKSKKFMATKIKLNTLPVDKSCPRMESDFPSKKPTEEKPVLPKVEEVLAEAVMVEIAVDESAKTDNRESLQNGASDHVPNVSEHSLDETAHIVSEEKPQNVTKTRKPSKSHAVVKERPKEKKMKMGVTNTVKSKKKQKDPDNKTKFRQPTKMKQLGKIPLVQESLDEKLKVKEISGEATSDPSTPVDSSSLNEKTTTPTATTTAAATKEKTKKETTNKKLKKPIKSNNSDPVKANNKRKSVPGDSNKKVKKVKSNDVECATSEPGVQASSDVTMETEKISAGEEGKTFDVVKEKPQNVKSSVCIEALAVYGKMPHVRPPPTVYLDEKFISMPKRRKETLPPHSSPTNLPSAQSIVVATPQRQRCSKCFATFNSNEELQRHLQQQTCSNLFGFDSDDEDNS